ncbi:MAG: hypothetical protein ABIP06_12895 [Pyrinomonadaceae bacterium]
MKKKNTQSPDKISAAEKDYSSELDAPMWSVVTFEKCAAKGLTYAEASEKLQKLKSEKVSGLCIVTDEAAANIKAEKK